MMSWRGLVALLVVGLLSACAAAPKKAMEQDARLHRVIVLIEQQELLVDKPDVGNGGGGLLGALIEGVIESKMEKNRQAYIGAVRDTLVDFDFEQAFGAALRTALNDRLDASADAIRIVRNNEQLDAVLKEDAGKLVLRLTVQYGLQQEYRGLTVRTWATAGISTVDKKGRPTIERWTSGAYYSEHATELAGGMNENYEFNAPYWAGETKPALQALEKAIPEVASLIADDLGQPVQSNGPSVKFFSLGVGAYPVTKAAQVRTDNNRLLLAGSYGLLFWIDNAQLL